MTPYKRYRLKYLFVRLDEILLDDLMMESAFVLDIVHNPIRRIVV
jgi:hypothetical protein